MSAEYLKASMSEEHRSRFAPGPMVISLGMGLVAPIVLGVKNQGNEVVADFTETLLFKPRQA